MCYILQICVKLYVFTKYLRIDLRVQGRNSVVYVHALSCTGLIPGQTRRGLEEEVGVGRGGGGRDFVKPRWVYVILGRAISNPNHLRNKTRAERQVCSLKTSYCITYVISCYTVYSFNNICHVTPLLRKILPTLQCIRKVTQRMRLYIRNTTGRIGHKAVGNVIN